MSDMYMALINGAAVYFAQPDALKVKFRIRDPDTLLATFLYKKVKTRQSRRYAEN